MSKGLNYTYKDGVASFYISIEDEQAITNALHQDILKVLRKYYPATPVKDKDA